MEFRPVPKTALEKRLRKAGNDLLDPPPPSSPNSLQKILRLLNELFLYLLEVEQDPETSMKNALAPSMKALVAGELLEHWNVDVKVVVTACITQIMKITAPDAPYDNEKMKKVLELIVSSFESLSDISSPSYAKSIHILETVAKARIHAVMLDIASDSLLIDMFQHFLKNLRDDHLENVVFCMEFIMYDVLEESDDISPELLSPILDYVKNDDEVPQVSRRLAEEVLIRLEFSGILGTSLSKAIEASGVSLDKYSDLVTSICEGKFSNLYQNEVSHENTEEKSTHEMVEEEYHVEAETRTQKRTRVDHKSNAEPENKELPKPCTVLDQLAKVKHGIVDTITSVRQFRSELETKEESIVDNLTSVPQFRSDMKKKEDNLEASLQEFDVLGEKMGINKIHNS